MKVQEQRETLRSQMGNFIHLSELRVVLLGYGYAGKSASGNTILGREEFDLWTTAAQCVKRQGEVAWRQVTVVDTPGWWRNHPVEETTELVKQEIVRSVSLCPPGPHTLLLVIRLDLPFTDKERRSVEGHLQLLSERVWSHTIVLFTYGDSLGDASIEQHIETEGKDLQWLVEKCGNRYHVLNNKKRGDGTQVTELLDKMEEMVAGNRGGHYEMDREMLEKKKIPKKMEEKRRAEEERRRAKEERAQHRLMKVQEQRDTLGSLMGAGGRSDVLSQRSTDYGSSRSIATSGSSGYGSSRSLATSGSSGYGSSRSLATSGSSGYGSSSSIASSYQGSSGYGSQTTGTKSLWRLLRRYNPFTTIREKVFLCQVLPFLQSLGPLHSVLNVIVVPENFPITEVMKMHRSSTYISVSSHCTITRKKLYSLYCDGVERNMIQPEHAEIYWSNGPDYHPTFQVLLSADTEEVKLRLLEKDGGEQVWAAHVQLPAPGASSMGGRQTEHAQSGSAEERLRSGLLLNTLEELGKHELKEFQWWMKRSVLDGFSPISTCHLENADRHDTVDTMVKTYTLEGALKISVEILRRMNQNDLSQKLAREAGVKRSTSSPPPQAAVYLTNQTGGASSLGGRQTEHSQSGSAEERLRSARREFVKRAAEVVMDSLLNGLLEKRVIDEDERDSVKEEKERAERARLLIDMVLGKGDQPCSVMMDLLAGLDSYLHSTLGFS